MGSGFWTGLIDTVGSGITERRETQHREDMQRDQMRLDRLQKELSSPYFDPAHLPDVLGEMDEIIAGHGKPKAKPKKAGIFSKILGGIEEGAAIPSASPDQITPLPADHFLTPDAIAERKLEELKKTKKVETDEQIRLEQERQKRRQKIGAGIEGLNLPLGTQTVDGEAPDPKLHYDLFQVGDQRIAVPAKEPAARTKSGWVKEVDGTYSSVEMDRNTGAILNKTQNVQPPASYLPSIHEGYFTFVDENNQVVVQPVTTSTRRESPGLPPIPSQGDAAPGTGVKTGTARAVATARPTSASTGKAGGISITDAKARLQYINTAATKEATTYDPDKPERSQDINAIRERLSQEVYGMPYADLQSVAQGGDSDRAKLTKAKIGDVVTLSDGRKFKKTGASTASPVK